MISEFTIRQIPYNSSDYDAEVRLRDEVLRRPLGLRFTIEDLKSEKNHIHFAAFAVKDNDLVGTLQLQVLSKSELKMRQVAVSPRFQRQGLGRALVAAAEKFAQENSYDTIKLNARDTAIAFYLSLNYELVGDPFIEVTIPHRLMQKHLNR